MASLRSVSDSIVIDASPAEIFAVLADPRRHHLIDGSSSVRGMVQGPPRLGPGAQFGMRMRFVLPYRVTNTVAEFDEGRLIAWHHAAKARWRYELTPRPDGHTEVRESFDWSRSPVALGIELARFPARNLISIRQTLIRLKRLVEAR